ncbi:MAG TPA: glycosyltransferase family A protein [Chloroflexota bacterium]|nr:glycosyltransferase family A protein [Chloroflexota bacterium]HUM67932.1 glycosyltransferase family A protein [Chloroflexota bacterium]
MVENLPLVSVIMPFYNTPPLFMREAIDSILAQTYPHWELLLVDDGSSNAASSAMAQAYAAAHPQKIFYLEHPNHANRGLGPSRQLALEHSHGNLITILDADDLWLPPKLTEQVALLTEYPEVGMVYGRTKYWYSWNSNSQDKVQDFTPPSGVEANTILLPPELLLLFVRQQIAIPCTCSIMFRHEALSSGFEPGIGGFFYEDQMLYAKICLQMPVLIADVCWDYYRQHPDSGTYRASDRGQELHLEYLQWLATYMQQQQVEDLALWQAVSRQIWLYRQPTWLPKRLRQPMRLSKKWLLRLEARLPVSVQHKFWQDR